MLSEQEKEWLERRKNLCGRCEWNIYGNPCVKYGRAGEMGTCKGFEPREVGSDYYRDAAEFEARVSVIAAKKAAALMQEESAWHVIRDCRLAVESEMDDQSK